MNEINQIQNSGWFWCISFDKGPIYADKPYCARAWKYLDWKGQPVRKGKPYNPQKRIVKTGFGSTIEEAISCLRTKLV